MISYQDLAFKYLEAQQLILTIGVLGIAMAIGLWVVWGKYDTVMQYLKDDGQIVRMAKWKAKKDQEKKHIAYHAFSGGTVAQCKNDKCKGL